MQTTPLDIPAEAHAFGKLRWRLARNQARFLLREARLKVAAVAVLTGLFWLGSYWLFAEGLELLRLAIAHDGWGSFDQDRPLYIEGRVLKSRWQNPHAELEVELTAGLRLPSDLAQRPLPAQTAPVDGKGLLAKTALPTRKDRRWEVELAPLTRLEAWKLAEIKAGATVAVVGFTFKEEKGNPVLRAEYLFVDANANGLPSSPA